MGDDRRGISAIVATVLIILITVAGVTIIWTAIIPMISEGFSEEDYNGVLSVDTLNGYTFWNGTALYVQVKRGVDESNIRGLMLVIDIEGNSIVKEYGLNVVPETNGRKMIVVDGVGNLPDKIKVTPLYSGDQGHVQGHAFEAENIVSGVAETLLEFTPDIDNEVSLNDCSPGEVDDTCSDNNECTENDERVCGVDGSWGACGGEALVDGSTCAVGTRMCVAGVCCSEVIGDVCWGDPNKVIGESGDNCQPLSGFCGQQIVNCPCENGCNIDDHKCV